MRRVEGVRAARGRAQWRGAANPRAEGALSAEEGRETLGKHEREREQSSSLAERTRSNFAGTEIALSAEPEATGAEVSGRARAGILALDEAEARSRRG